MPYDLKHIEAIQGVAESGRVFGYDHSRNNFIEWQIKGGKLDVWSITHDETSDLETGLLRLTRRDAGDFARRQNKLPNSLVIQRVLALQSSL